MKKLIALVGTIALFAGLTIGVAEAAPNKTVDASVTRVAPFTYEYTFDGKPGQFPRLNLVLRCIGDPAYTSDGYNVYVVQVFYIDKGDYASGTVTFDVTSGWNRWVERGEGEAECQVYLRDWTSHGLNGTEERRHAESEVSVDVYPG